MSRVIIASLKFSPGHINHIEAFGKGFGRLGHDVEYILAREYQALAGQLSAYGQVRYVSKYDRDIGEPNRGDQAGLMVLMNPALLNVRIARKYQRLGARVVYLYHEPWRGAKYYARLGIRSLLRAPIIRLATIGLLRHTDIVVVPSNTALTLYQQRSSRYNGQVRVIPLLFVDRYDEQSAPPGPGERKYISFIGHAVREHHLELFCQVVDYAAQVGIANGMRFLVATSSKLSRKQLDMLRVHERNGLVDLRSGEVLDSDTIDWCFRSSLVVWNVYASSTQSGVMAQAFMHGTPVIASKIGGLAEYVEPGVNGEFVSSAEPAAILEAINRIVNNEARYIAGARRTFLRQFEVTRHVDRLKELL